MGAADAVPKPDEASTPAMAEMMGKLMGEVAKLAEAVNKLQQAPPVAKSEPAGDLAALLKLAADTQPAPARSPILEAYLSGDRHALQKAAILAGTPDHPDVEAVYRMVDAEYTRMAGPKWTRLMIAQGLANPLPDLS